MAFTNGHNHNHDHETVPVVDAAAVLQQFDNLIEEGELFYSPTHPTFQFDEGFKFEFRICPSFKSKPQPGAKENGHLVTAQSASRPPPSDGSDIDHDDPAFFVANISSTHKLILNKFCVFRPQHLLLTLDPTRRQTEPLDVEDFTAAWTALQSLDNSGAGEKHYVIYNGGKAGGSSRRHKHMQLLAQPLAADGDLELVPYRAGQLEKLPCVSFYTPLGKEMSPSSGMTHEEAGIKLAAIAAGHYAGTRKALEVDEGDKTTPVAYNVMLTTDWILTVPRRAATVEGKLKDHVVGCQGVLGSVWVIKEEQQQAWKDIGPANVVRHLGVPK